MKKKGYLFFFIIIIVILIGGIFFFKMNSQIILLKDLDLEKTNFKERSLTKDYNITDNSVSIKQNSIEIAKLKLNTPLNYQVIRGKDRLVGEFTINSKTMYDNAFKSMDFIDLKSNRNITRTFKYKYKIIESYEEDQPVYGNCTDRFPCDFKKNESCKGLDYYEATYNCIIDTKKVTLYKDKWIDLEQSKIQRLEEGNITIGIFTDVYANENIEWIPTFFDTKIEEWASWNESFNNGLVAYWGFDTNNSYDDYLGKYNGTAQTRSTPIKWVSSCKLGGCINFTNTESNSFTNASFINITSPTGLFKTGEAFTVSIWTYNQNFNLGSCFLTSIEQQTDTYPMIKLCHGGSPYYAWFQLDGSSGKISRVRSTGMARGVWTNIVYVYNGSLGNTGLAFYQNGTLATDTTVWEAGPISGNVSITKLSIGAGPTGWYGINGLIDDIAVWNRTLSSAEIASLWNSGSGINYTLPSSSDTSYPIFSNNGYNLTNNTEYNLNINVKFNTTIINSNGTAGIEFNGTNYTLSNSSNEFYKTISYLGAGVYSYYYWSYGNGTSNLFNNSQTYYYTIAKNNSYVLNINNSLAPFGYINYGSPSNYSGLGCPNQLICKLYRNNTGEITSPDTEILSAGFYNYTYNTSGNLNYTSKTVSLNLEVQKATRTCELVNYQESWTRFYDGSETVVSCNISAGENDGTIEFYKNLTEVTNPDSTINAGVYDYTCYIGDGENYTECNQVEETLTINKVQRTCSLKIDDTEYTIYSRDYDGNPSTITCTVDIADYEGTFNFTKNDTEITSPDEQTDGGTFYYTCQIIGSANYEDCEKLDTTFTINSISPNIYTYLNNSRQNISILKGESIYLNGTVDNSLQILLYKNNTLINSGTTQVSNYSLFNTTGIFNITSMSVATNNYYSVYETWFVNVTIGECIPNYANTTKSDWINLSCIATNQRNQQRNWTQYDLNECISNQTFYEYQTITDTSCIVTTTGTITPICRYKKLGYYNLKLPWLKQKNCI